MPPTPSFELPGFIQLSFIDWAIILGYMAFALAVGFYFTRRAGSNMSEFFVSGRSLPWWIVGTSMVATTFSTDTPNFMTNIVRVQGISGLWKPWAFVLTHMLTVFFFARLWRRSELLTDVEFYEFRYSGKSAAFLRAFRAIYLGLFFNVLVMAMVTLAAGKIGAVLFGWDRLTVVLVCAAITVLYAGLGGLWGVIVTDLVQFVMAMTGSVLATWYVLRMPAVGGLDGLFTKLADSGMGQRMNFFPDFSQPGLALELMILPFLVMWWSSWWPGSEPGGGGYVAQRMFSSKDERNSLLATFWFYIAHNAVRPWPWFLMALASLVVFPVIDQPTLGHILPHLSAEEFRPDLGYSLMLRLLPAGIIGLMVASLGAAYMSTIDTHLNWGSSYLVNDVYKRFFKPNASDKHYVLISRLCTVVLMVLAVVVSFWLTDALSTFELIMTVGAGTGLIYILRWYWHRINAWTEISAMIAAVTSSLLVRRWAPDLGFGPQFLVVLGSTTAVWLTVTLLTPPTDPEVLESFYRKIRPAGPGWNTVRARLGGLPSRDSIGWSFAGMMLGLTMIYCAIFGVGNLCYQRPLLGTLLCLVSAIAFATIIRLRGKLLGSRPAADPAEAVSLSAN